MVSAVERQSVFIITHEFYPRRGGIATFTEEIAKNEAELADEKQQSIDAAQQMITRGPQV